MEIIIQELKPSMANDYIDFFENRAFSDGNINKGCYCVWHHWTEKHEYNRSMLPVEERPFCKRNYAVELIENNILHGFAAYDKDKMVGFCNADMKEHYFRLDKVKKADTWEGIKDGEKVLAMVCFTVAPDYRGQGIAGKLLSFACEYACKNGYDYIESYPSDGVFDPNNCCGNRSMYERQRFDIISIKDGILARKKCLN